MDKKSQKDRNRIQGIVKNKKNLNDITAKKKNKKPPKRGAFYLTYLITRALLVPTSLPL